MTVKIDRKLAKKVLDIVDKGLVSGIGNPVPGECCVEAAVCLAMGLPHGDEPECVAPALRALKITLNDAAWSSNDARAKGLRRLALAQLGSKGALDETEFARRVAEQTIRITVSRALHFAANAHPQEEHKIKLRAAAEACFKNGKKEDASAASRAASDASLAASWAASDAASWAASAASDAELSGFAEMIVQVLVEIKAPGCKFLRLTE